jgi:predicted protein tyrosine phosphatase
MNEFPKLADEDTLVIGIWSPGDYEKLQKEDLDYIDFYEKAFKAFNESIRLEFWDTEDNVPGYPTISKEQAQELVDFILKNANKKFVIHCDAGQSRSAGVALAVECLLDHDGDKYSFSQSGAFVDKPEYSPNRRVYDKILQEVNA